MSVTLQLSSGRVKLALGIARFQYTNPSQAATSLVAVFVALRSIDSKILYYILWYINHKALILYCTFISQEQNTLRFPLLCCPFLVGQFISAAK